NYPGANAQVVAAREAAPIEQAVNVVRGLRCRFSEWAKYRSCSLTVTLEPGTGRIFREVLVQNLESLAGARLPVLVKRRGISVKKKSPNVLMIVNLYSAEETQPSQPAKDGKNKMKAREGRTSLELSNYATIQIRDELSRLQGVGDVTYLGQRNYSMRLWL